MMRPISLAPLVALVAATFLNVPAVQAMENPAPPPPGSTAPAPSPQLGVVIDEANFDASKDQGLLVKSVKPSTTAAALGIQPGDYLKILNGKTVASVQSLKQIMETAKVGDPISAQISRSGEVKTFTGTVLEAPKLKNVGDEVTKLRDDIARMHELVPQKKDLTLAEVVQALQEIEDKLPEAVAKFKQQYPNGEFNISFKVEIVSDKNAKNPVNLMETSKPDGEGAAPQK